MTSRKLPKAAAAALEPYRAIYADAYARILAEMATCPDLDALEAAAREPTASNCGFMTYDAARLVRLGMAYTRAGRAREGSAE